MANLSDKLMLITGANTGIGKATALELAKRGAQVIMHARNPQKGEAARAEVQELSANPKVDLVLADLSDQAQIAKMIAGIKQDYGRLDVLVNNAAIIPRERTLTPSGIELQFAVNHLAYFALALGLLELLKASPQGRIVNVSSSLHWSGAIEFDNLQAEKSYPRWGWGHYNNTKLMNVAFTVELAERLKDSTVTVNALHPGVINTELTRDIPWLSPVKRLFFGTPSNGAKTSVHLATMPDSINGQYFDNAQVARHNPIADDPAIRAKLWAISAEMTKG